MGSWYGIVVSIVPEASSNGDHMSQEHRQTEPQRRSVGYAHPQLQRYEVKSLFDDELDFGD
jgi:hypothetical protein